MHISAFRHIAFSTLQLARASARTALLVLVVVGCGGSGATVASPAPDEVAIRSFAFNPSPRTVAAGTRVTWKNHDDDAHTVSGDEGPEIWESGSLGRNGTFSRTFTIPGTYRYSCSIHPEMRGSIIVGQAAFYKSDLGIAASFAAGNVISGAELAPGR